MIDQRPVVQITPYYPPHLGGVEGVVKYVAQELSDRRDVMVMTTDVGARDLPRWTLEGRVRVLRHGAVEIGHTPIAPGIVRSILRLPRTSVLHLHTAHAVLPEQVLAATALKRQPFLVHFHLDVDASGPFGWLLPHYKALAFSRVLRAAAGVIVLTESQANFVRDTYDVAAAKIFVVPNGVATEFFMPVRQGVNRPLRLLFVGRLGSQKNLLRLLGAVSRLKREVTLEIVGQGEQSATLREACRSMRLDNVSFAGRRVGDELLESYANADAFVLSSDKEGMALAALEAMAAGLPVIATDVPGNKELLKNVGILVEPRADALAEAIDAVAGDDEMRRELAVQSRSAARQYSWKAVARRIERVYEEVLPY